MSKEFTLQAESRSEQGKGASRRLRRENKVPAVIYGAGQSAQSISLKHNELIRNLQDEAFYSQLIAVNFGDRKEIAILRALQRHPAKPIILHVDLQRIKDDEVIEVHIPLHFTNEENAVGVKVNGGTVSRILNEVMVACLPKNIPEYIEVDMLNVDKGQIVHLSDLKLPEGVSIPELSLGSDHNQAVAAIH